MTGCVETSNHPQAPKPVSKPYTVEQCTQAGNTIDNWRKNIEKSDNYRPPQSEVKFVENSVHYCPKVKKRVDEINAGAAQLRKSAAEREKQKSATKNVKTRTECVTSNDTEFARLVNDLKSQLSYYDDAETASFSKCGWVETVSKSGITYRHSYSDLEGDINFVYGKPVYLMAKRYSYRFQGKKAFSYEPTSKRVAYISTANLSTSQRAVDRLNSTVARLAKVATGETITVRSGAEQAASVKRTQGNLKAVGTVLGGIAAAGANTSPTSTTPSSSNSGAQCKASKRQCYASCEGLENTSNSINFGIGSTARSRCKKQCSSISC